MSAMQQQNHAGTCIGHCRAQRHEMNYYCTEQYEKDKAAIKSYEDGWDRWDGPVWPWRHTNYPNVQSKIEDEEAWQGCCCTPSEEEVEKLGRPIENTSKPEVQHTQQPTSTETSASPSSSLWSSRTNSPGPIYGAMVTSSHI